MAKSRQHSDSLAQTNLCIKTVQTANTVCQVYSVSVSGSADSPHDGIIHRIPIGYRLPEALCGVLMAMSLLSLPILLTFVFCVLDNHAYMYKVM